MHRANKILPLVGYQSPYEDTIVFEYFNCI
jgi:hypothetical protein